MILFGIVLYKEQLSNAISFLSLLESYRLRKDSINENLRIVVFDNTDVDNWKQEEVNIPGVEIAYFSDNSNPGISYAYNSIVKYAEDCGLEWVVFLDQDSTLSLQSFDSYFDYVKDAQSLIAIPKVFSNNLLISPTEMYLYRPKFLQSSCLGDTIPIKNISCINTGLLINTHFFRRVGNYNINLRVDFCDHEFIHRVKNYCNQISILNFEVLQEFSVNNNNLQQDLNRYRIFLKDFKVYKKVVNSLAITFTVDIPHLIRLSLKHRTLIFIKIWLKN